MGLDAAVYAGDACETQIVSFRIGNFDNIITSTIEQRQEWLRKVREVVRRHFPKASIA